MKQRSIARVIYANTFDMGGMPVRQPLPSSGLEDLDPFVLLHHFRTTFASDGEHKGLGAHPHRGFSPVTFLFTGSMSHFDSRGNRATVGAGGTQWLHAGSGILHDESPIGTELEGIQMWVNSPARHKMDDPVYSPVQRDETPAIITPDGGRINVIAGTIDGTRGPIPTLTPITATTLELKTGNKVILPVVASHAAFLYLLDGKVEFGDGSTASGHHMILFAHDGDAIEFQAVSATRALFMSGEPLNEPIVARGPFVMNSEEEIRQAYRDYIAGYMGVVEA
jgi:redox-sensitive bicupin YhaK (pirin superfamily)